MKADPSRYLEFRRDIHRHPELSNQEVETTRRIREFLARDGLELCPIGALNGGFVRINAGKARTCACGRISTPAADRAYRRSVLLRPRGSHARLRPRYAHRHRRWDRL